MGQNVILFKFDWKRRRNPAKKHTFSEYSTQNTSSNGWLHREIRRFYRHTQKIVKMVLKTRTNKHFFELKKMIVVLFMNKIDQTKHTERISMDRHKLACLPSKIQHPTKMHNWTKTMPKEQWNVVSGAELKVMCAPINWTRNERERHVRNRLSTPTTASNNKTGKCWCIHLVCSVRFSSVWHCCWFHV